MPGLLLLDPPQNSTLTTRRILNLSKLPQAFPANVAYFLRCFGKILIWLASVRGNVTDWCGLRAGAGFGGGLGHVLGFEARDHLVGHGQGVDGGSDFDGAFSYVFFIDALVSVQIGVMREGAVVEGILRQADAGQAGVVKGSAVRAASSAAVAGGNSRKSPIRKGHQGFANHVGGGGGAKNCGAAGNRC